MINAVTGIPLRSITGEIRPFMALPVPALPVTILVADTVLRLPRLPGNPG